MAENDNILVELIQNQRKNIINKKLSFYDLKRISKYLNKSIFDNDCSLWNGYINKNLYINIYYNGKKIALHRLLYLNYIGDLNDSEYIKFNCCNKGICCNINHFYKILKTENENNIIPNNNLDQIEKKIEIKNITVDFNI